MHYLDNRAEPFISQFSGARKGRLIRHVHGPHGCDVVWKVRAGCGLHWADVHGNQALHQLWLWERSRLGTLGQVPRSGTQPSKARWSSRLPAEGSGSTTDRRKPWRGTAHPLKCQQHGGPASHAVANEDAGHQAQLGQEVLQILAHGLIAHVWAVRALTMVPSIHCQHLGKREVGSSAGIHSQGRAKSLADLQAEGGGEPGVGEIQKGERARMVRRPLFSDLGGPNEEPEPLCQKAQGV